MENYKQAHKISPKSGRGLGHVTPTIFGSTVGYPSDSLASCIYSLHYSDVRRQYCRPTMSLNHCV